MLPGFHDPEDGMNVGKTLFAQVMEFVPWKAFSRIVVKHRGDNGIRTLSCADLFRILAFSQLTWRESLRDIEACLTANQSKLFHMGLAQPPARSTLADALNHRDWRIYQAVALRLISRARCLYGDESVLDLDATVYALDATTVELCLSLFDWASVYPERAAIKLHTLLDLLPIESGSFYVMDRGYLDFQRLFTMHQAGAFFVTRAKSVTDVRRVYSSATERDRGVICDQRVLLHGRRSRKRYPELLRRIRFRDPDSDNTLVFLTNNTALPALTIAALYKSRWQVELFFKWIKQHLRIKRFLATTENAVKTQIWCAIATYVLIAIIKKELQLNASLYTCLQILSVYIFEKTQLSCALHQSGVAPNAIKLSNQLILFDF